MAGKQRTKFLEKFFINYTSVADPGSGAFLTPGSGIKDGKKSDPDPGWKEFWSGIRDKHPGSTTLICTFMV
jgi:hypothetical protein